MFVLEIWLWIIDNGYVHSNYVYLFICVHFFLLKAHFSSYFKLWIVLIALFCGFELMRFENFVDFSSTFHLFLIVFCFRFCCNLCCCCETICDEIGQKEARHIQQIWIKWLLLYFSPFVPICSSLFIIKIRKMNEHEKKSCSDTRIDRNIIEY